MGLKHTSWSTICLKTYLLKTPLEPYNALTPLEHDAANHPVQSGKVTRPLHLHLAPAVRRQAMNPEMEAQGPLLN